VSVQQDRWSELVDGQMANGRSRAEAERLLAQRYPRLAEVVGKGQPKAADEPKPGAGRADFWGLVNDLVRRGVSKPMAIARVVREHPEAHAEMLEEYNLEHAAVRR